MNVLSAQPVDRDLVLDFWRGVGILMVIAHHLFYFHFSAFRIFAASVPIGAFEQILWWANQVLIGFSERAGPWGVKFFFIVSGYIITLLVLREEEKYGRLRIGTFYVKRLFRILPPYLFYLFGISIFAALSWVALPSSDVLTAGAFLCNTVLPCGWFVVHTWTLAIEMQFYLVWPIFFIILPVRHRCLFLTILLAVLYICSAFGVFVTRGWIDNALSFSCIVLGALCALYPNLRAMLQKYGFWYIGAIIFIIGSVYLFGFGEVARVIYRITTPIVLTALIFSTYQYKRLIRSWVFTAVASIGLVSYSLYLWQQVFLAPSEQYLSPSILQNFLFMIVCCLFSYYAVEKPFIRLKKSFLERYAFRAKV